MSKPLFFILLIVAAAGFYFYKSNVFTNVEASFTYTPEDISVTARESDLHDCKLALTHDYEVELPILRRGQRKTIDKTEFKQWNGTTLESISALGPDIEFKLRCKEGGRKTKESNRYLHSTPDERNPPAEEVIESN